MIQYGGSFVSALGKAARYADVGNLARLRDAFPDYWRNYAEMVLLERKWKRAGQTPEGTEP